jgi:K+-transporting ATPase ATPase A chain
MRWTEYALSIVWYSVVSGIILYLIQRLQGVLPFNPQDLAGVDVAANTGSSFNSAVSFITNTNWQSYVPEVTMSYLTQMAGLSYHNFASAATGIAIAIAFMRGIVRKESDTIGNFWVDFVRANLYVLLPFCLIGAMLLVSQGVVQNFNAYDSATLVDKTISVEVDKKDADGNVITDADGENVKETNAVTTQTIAQGPVASQEAIKMWGTNGGGFFNANSAHPFENPTPFSNVLQLFAIFAISAGLTYTLGRMTGLQRHGWAVFAAMSVLFFVGVFVTYWAEARGNPMLAGVDQTASATQSGGNFEGKEVRFGIASSVFAVVAGTNVFIPVRNRTYNIGSYSYVNASKTFNEKTRLTAGGYFYSKNVVASSSRGGAQFGVEHTVNSKFIVAADYLTGKHANGYFTPGVFYKPTPKVTGYFGYSIGNDNARGGNSFFLFEIGYNFN